MSGNNKGKPCTSAIGPYNKLKCPEGNHAHHIVPDFTQRFGTRKDTASRIEGAASLGNGPAICLPGKPTVENGTKVPSKHVVAHQNTDAVIKSLGVEARTVDGVHYPEGTAPLSEVKKASVDGVKAAVPECGKKINDAVNEAFPKSADKTPCRTTKSLPKEEAKGNLSTYRPSNNSQRG